MIIENEVIIENQILILRILRRSKLVTEQSQKEAIKNAIKKSEDVIYGI